MKDNFIDILRASVVKTRPVCIKEIFVWYYLDEHHGPTDDYVFNDNGTVKLVTMEVLHKGVDTSLKLNKIKCPG